MLTQRRSDALRFIGSFIAEHGYAPTREQIGAGIGGGARFRTAERGRLTRQVAGRLVTKLVLDGYVAVVDEPGVRRGTIALTPAGIEFLRRVEGGAA